MAIHTIYIDGSIGPWSYSKQFMRDQLAGHKQDQVVLKISSLGGNVDDAISIFDQLREHGNVTVELSSFVASSATVISLGAHTVKMNENSFYLIHAAMEWVDEWGTLNQTAIETLIEKLEKSKKELSKVTLQLAKMYMSKTGKTLETIIDLMKQETWLNAEEALKWGFVDEIIKSSGVENQQKNLQMVAMIHSNGMPPPPENHTASAPGGNVSPDKESVFSYVWSRFKNKQKEENSSNKKPLNMEKQFLLVNKTLETESLECSKEGVFFNPEQLQKIEDQLSLNQQITEKRDAAVSEKNAAIAQRDKALGEVSATAGLFDAIDPAVAGAETAQAKVDAIRALLAAKPGTGPDGILDTGDPVGTPPENENWEIIDNLPHNKIVDQNL